MSDGAVGGGVFQGQAPCDELGEAGDTSDTGLGDVVLTGGGVCAHGPSVGPWVVFLVVLHVLLRTASAADIQTLHPLGDDFVSMRSVSIGPAWTGRFAMSGNLSVMPLALRSTDDGRRTALIAAATTVRLFGSMAFGRHVRAGVVLPVHHLSGIYSGLARGDVLLQVVLGDDDMPLSSVVEVERSHRRALQGYGTNAVAGGLVGRQGVFGWQVMVRIQPNGDAFGASTASRLEPAVGVRRQLADRLYGSLEVFGAVPLSVPASLNEVPLEVLGSARWALDDNVFVKLAGGMGLTSGLGSPAMRVVAAVELRRPKSEDVDGDGLLAPRDLCPRRAEDRDGHRDADGCPDSDNDRDGFLDVVDACPDEPETVNGIHDDDGCPDAPAGWTVSVRGPEVWSLTSTGHPTVRRLAGETWSTTGEAGDRTVLIEADGYVARSVTSTLHEGKTTDDVITLDPLLVGRLDLTVLDPEGQLVEAVVEIEGVEHVLEAGHLVRDEPVGRPRVRIRAAGLSPAELQLELVPDETTVSTVTLERPVVQRDGNVIATSGSPLFDVNADTLADTVSLEALADWLLAHPEIVLLRVEGHADPLGPSAYNFSLSNRRAHNTAEVLVGRGVARDRLQVIGAGEALAGDGPLRQVGFTVLVWEEDSGP